MEGTPGLLPFQVYGVPTQLRLHTAERSNKTPGTWENRHKERQQQVR